MTVSATILTQLGGNKFIAMTGAKNFVSGPSALTFSIGRNKSKANKVRIMLRNDDTYVVEFASLRGINYRIIDFIDGIQADGMVSYFEAYTGLATRL